MGTQRQRVEIIGNPGFMSMQMLNDGRDEICHQDLFKILDFY